MRRITRQVSVALLLAITPAAAQRPIVTAPPAKWATDPFYARYADADGIPILASTRTPDRAILLAREIVRSMLSARPDLAAELVRQGQRVAIMAPDETTLDIPEQRDWKKPAATDPRLTRCERKHYATRIGALTDRTYWDARARGMGGPLTSVGAENLLAGPNDRYHGSSILVHEFSHAILRAALAVDPALHARVAAAYARAMEKGLWAGEYASTTVDEYWAVGTQYWFNTARIASFGETRVLSDADLRAYDPGLYAVLSEVYRGHQAAGDLFHNHPDRVPPGPLPAYTAEVC
ncbi:glycoside hydrolase [Sphingomonas rubra]|uniref:Glycoside hydrolase n=1 Tax=Sphingomonas rubra TaxID=634430 RepID=A0A1I5SF26_9SPHN|nr:glycoside hydrolase [Sphingomonas rubra]SFP69077.1 hypothetical protein SAMN04488241_105172 [Sphingomonas rubra]